MKISEILLKFAAGFVLACLVTAVVFVLSLAIGIGLIALAKLFGG